MKPFVSNEYPTIGIEQEFHLIDPETADLANEMENVWGRLTGRLKESISHELFLSVLESRSAVARTAGELAESIAKDRAELARACEECGVRLVAAGSHPFADPSKQMFVPSEHYQWVRREHGMLARRMLAFGLHLHVGMRSAEAALYVMNEMRRWAGPLLAFSANSPYFGGRASGLASTRRHIFRSMPRTHLPPVLTNMAELEAVYETLLAAGDITRPGDLWWGIRPQPPLGTVELRIFDLPTDINRLVVLVAITQAACAYYQDRFEAGTSLTEMRDVWLEQNEWKAMRYDPDAKIVDPATGQVLSMRQQFAELLDMVEPKGRELGAGEQFALARRLLNEPTESQWQRTTCQALGGDLAALEKAIAQKTVGRTGVENEPCR